MIPLVVLLAAVSIAGAGCGGGSLGSPDAGGRGGGSAAGSTGDGGSTGQGGTGAIDGGPLVCPIDPSVVTCDLGTLALGLTSPDEAYVAHGHAIASWDPVAHAWTNMYDGTGTLSSPDVRSFFIRFDSHGRPVVGFVTVSDVAAVTMNIMRWDGAGWTSILGAPSIIGTGAAVALATDTDIVFDALDRPILLLQAPSSPAPGQLRVVRRDGSSWTDLGGPARINSVPAASARLVLDSGDGLTPYLAYRSMNDPKTIVPARFDGTAWSELPAVARGLDQTFDFAVAGGQMYIAYGDGISPDDARLFLTQGSAAGWSAPLRLDGEGERALYATHILTLGPATTDVMVAWESIGATPESHQVSIKRAPDWAHVPSEPLGTEPMAGFAIAADATRVGLVWQNLDRSGPFVRYFEFAR